MGSLPTYGPNAYPGGVNNQGSATSYVVQDSDFSAWILFETASAVALSLNSNVRRNFYCWVANFSTGVITSTPTMGTINGGSSAAINAGQMGGFMWDGSNWWAIFPSFASLLSVDDIATTLPLMDGTATAGTSGTVSDAAHVHPTDTSRQAALTNPVTGPGAGCTVGHLAVMGNTAGTVIADGGAVPSGGATIGLNPATFAATQTINLSSGNRITQTLTANMTALTLTNLVDGLTYVFDLTQGSSAYTWAWPSNVLYAPALTPTTGANHVFTLFCCGTQLKCTGAVASA